jgi:hypothetical protein
MLCERLSGNLSQAGVQLTQLLIASGIAFPVGLAFNKWVTPRYLKYREHAKRVDAEIRQRIQDEEIE